MYTVSVYNFVLFFVFFADFICNAIIICKQLYNAMIITLHFER